MSPSTDFRQPVRLLIPALCAGALLLLGCSGTTSPLPGNSSVQNNGTGSNIGQTAADITGIDTTGASVKLSDYKGSVIVLDVSTQWCEWCQADAPQLQALYSQFQAQGLKVVTVLSEDDNQNQASQAVLQSWASTYGLTFRVMNDTTSSAPSTGVAEKVYVANPAAQGFPTLVVIDKTFTIQYLQGGYDATGVTAKVTALLAQ